MDRQLLNGHGPDGPLLAYAVDLESIIWAFESGKSVESELAFKRAAAGLRLAAVINWIRSTEPEVALPAVSLGAVNLSRIRKIISSEELVLVQRLAYVYNPSIELFVSERELSIRVGLAVSCTGHCLKLSPHEIGQRLGLDLRGLMQLVVGERYPDHALAKAIDNFITSPGTGYLRTVGTSAVEGRRRVELVREAIELLSVSQTQFSHRSQHQTS